MADDTEMDKVLATAQELDVPLIVHPCYVGPRPGLEDFYQANLAGNPLESTISEMAAGPLADQLRGVGLDDESVEDIAEGNTTRLVEVGAPGTSSPVTAGGTAEK